MQKDGLDEIYELLDNLKKKKVSIAEAEAELKKFYNKKGYDRGITLYNNLDNDFQPWGKINMSWPNGETFGPRYDVIHPFTKKATKVPDRGWRWNETTFEIYLLSFLFSSKRSERVLFNPFASATSFIFIYILFMAQQHYL